MPFDPTITQKVRTALLEAGHPDLVVEEISASVRELEREIYTLKRDVKLLQDAERERLTGTGAWRVVKAKLEEETIDWLKWAIRGTLALIGTGLFGGLCRLAWKGLHT